MPKFGLLISFLLLMERAPGGVAAGPEAPTRRPWEWTTGERLAARFDSSRKRESAASERVGAADTGEPADTILGSRNPELFLPWEVFDNLIALGFNENAAFQEKSRGIIDEKARTLEMETDFWRRLEQAAKPYIEIRRRVQRRIAEGVEAQEPEKAKIDRSLINFQRPYCRSRADALAAAREAFGAERFDRFLYQAIAPTMFVSGRNDPEQLRYAEEGCP